MGEDLTALEWLEKYGCTAVVLNVAGGLAWADWLKDQGFEKDAEDLKSRVKEMG